MSSDSGDLYTRNECSICLSDLSAGNHRILACLPCGHVFHRKCWNSYARRRSQASLDSNGLQECCLCRQVVTASGRIHLDFGDSLLHDDEFFQSILQHLASPAQQTVRDALASLESMLVDDTFVDKLIKSGHYLSTIFSTMKRHQDDSQTALRFSQVMLRLCGVSADFHNQPTAAIEGSAAAECTPPADSDALFSPRPTIARLDDQAAAATSQRARLTCDPPENTSRTVLGTAAAPWPTTIGQHKAALSANSINTNHAAAAADCNISAPVNNNARFENQATVSATTSAWAGVARGSPGLGIFAGMGTRAPLGTTTAPLPTPFGQQLAGRTADSGQANDAAATLWGVSPNVFHFGPTTSGAKGKFLQQSITQSLTPMPQSSSFSFEETRMRDYGIGRPGRHPFVNPLAASKNCKPSGISNISPASSQVEAGISSLEGPSATESFSFEELRLQHYESTNDVSRARSATTAPSFTLQASTDRSATTSQPARQALSQDQSPSFPFSAATAPTLGVDTSLISSADFPVEEPQISFHVGLAPFRKNSPKAFSKEWRQMRHSGFGWMLLPKASGMRRSRTSVAVGSSFPARIGVQGSAMPASLADSLTQPLDLGVFTTDTNQVNSVFCFGSASTDLTAASQREGVSEAAFVNDEVGLLRQIAVSHPEPQEAQPHEGIITLPAINVSHSTVEAIPMAETAALKLEDDSTTTKTLPTSAQDTKLPRSIGIHDDDRMDSTAGAGRPYASSFHFLPQSTNEIPLSVATFASTADEDQKRSASTLMHNFPTNLHCMTTRDGDLGNDVEGTSRPANLSSSFVSQFDSDKPTQDASLATNDEELIASAAADAAYNSILLFLERKELTTRIKMDDTEMTSSIGGAKRSATISSSIMELAPVSATSAARVSFDGQKTLERETLAAISDVFASVSTHPTSHGSRSNEASAYAMPRSASIELSPRQVASSYKTENIFHFGATSSLKADNHSSVGFADTAFVAQPATARRLFASATDLEVGGSSSGCSMISISDSEEQQ